MQLFRCSLEFINSFSVFPYQWVISQVESIWFQSDMLICLVRSSNPTLGFERDCDVWSFSTIILITDEVTTWYRYMFGIVKNTLPIIVKLQISEKSKAFPQNCPSDHRRANVPSSPKPLSIKSPFSIPAISGGLFWPLSGEVVEQLWIYVFVLLMKRNEWTSDRSFLCQLVDLFGAIYLFGVVSRYFLYICCALLGEQIRKNWIYFGMLSVANKGDCNWQRFLRPPKYPFFLSRKERYPKHQPWRSY